MQRLISIGLILLFLGIILIFIGSIFTAFKTDKSNVKVAAGGFIGFIPFGFFSDKKMFYILIALMIISLIFWYFIIK